MWLFQRRWRPEGDAIFLGYRRADEPFGAALVAAELRHRYGPRRVFLDTLALRPRSDPARTLPRALGACAVVVAFVGPRWDTGERLQRLSHEEDWVRRELLQFTGPVVPVFFDRPPVLADGVPEPLQDRLRDPLAVRRDAIAAGVDAVVERLDHLHVATPEHPGRTDLDARTISVGVDALLRHVLPAAQQRSGNRKMIVRTVPELLRTGDWLRHLVTAALPGRPNGSAVVAVTDDAVRVADLNGRFEIAERRDVALADVHAVERRGYRRAGLLRAADVRLRCTGTDDLLLTGLFRDEADEMLENLPAAGDPGR